jgi:thioredoxin-like negative regulator of GroEL
MGNVLKSLLMGIALILVATACPSFAADTKLDLQALAAKKMPALLEFGRGWCIPCKYMKPILEDMSRVYERKALVTTVDMDANKKLVKQFRIRMMPTQVFLTSDGKEFFRHEGTLEREQIAEIFAKMGVAASAQGPAMITVPGQPGGR